VGGVGGGFGQNWSESEAGGSERLWLTLIGEFEAGEWQRWESGGTGRGEWSGVDILGQNLNLKHRFLCRLKKCHFVRTKES